MITADGPPRKVLDARNPEDVAGCLESGPLATRRTFRGEERERLSQMQASVRFDHPKHDGVVQAVFDARRVFEPAVE